MVPGDGQSCQTVVTGQNSATEAGARASLADSKHPAEQRESSIVGKAAGPTPASPPRVTSMLDETERSIVARGTKDGRRTRIEIKTGPMRIWIARLIDPHLAFPIVDQRQQTVVRVRGQGRAKRQDHRSDRRELNRPTERRVRIRVHRYRIEMFPDNFNETLDPERVEISEVADVAL